MIITLGYGDMGIGTDEVDSIYIDHLLEPRPIGEDAQGLSLPLVRLVFTKVESLQVLIDVAEHLLRRMEGQEVAPGQNVTYPGRGGSNHGSLSEGGVM